MIMSLKSRLSTKKKNTAMIHYIDQTIADVNEHILSDISEIYEKVANNKNEIYDEFQKLDDRLDKDLGKLCNISSWSYNFYS